MKRLSNYRLGPISWAAGLILAGIFLLLLNFEFFARFEPTAQYLLAALLAYPADWGARVWGAIAGFAAIQVANLARIITLFYLAGWNQSVFEFAHLYLWQALIMLDVVIVWLLWIRWVTKRQFADAID